jgi:VIT1/CCC1 family predicted Fe2+/Mn2+ transporter
MSRRYSYMATTNRRNGEHDSEVSKLKARLIQAVIAASVAAVVGVGVSIWIKSDQMLGIVIGTALVGFIFGLAFKIRAV